LTPDLLEHRIAPVDDYGEETVKVKIVLLCLAGLLVFSATAEADYILPFGKARKYSKEWVREACEASGPNCIYWKVGKCVRINQQRVDCAGALAYRDKTVCGLVIENRVKGNGFVHQRRRHTRCEKV
jgi:hypothetical protein